METKKQSAVEWLVERLTELGVDLLSHNLEIQQAKAMEKEQIIEANEDCSTNELGEFLTGEQYYNQTFNK
jgi:hypothetical protein